eukprot:CAMPEP_0172517074 /NCGR_PEP_ID=MMETSP1066-20121228/281528_1 /TAXON_ID=671091 /ORGANISM="Coscinodiscus wailesii, Strain CCMP2513" /LENGTH=122 /DNA_ID=CAMNT_0013298849 /DNA_START=258 /DNA_END=626 /DNA_ORIENTATION=-
MTWTSYVGRSADTEEYGEGGDTESICVGRLRAADDDADAFLGGNGGDAAAAAGSWELTSRCCCPVRVTLEGKGWGSASAIEDDDLICAGSGSLDNVKFSVTLKDLQEKYTHTLSSLVPSDVL